MRERLAVQSGRLVAMATGEARGSRVGVASGGRERHLVPCAVGIWRGLRILWREDGEQFVQVTVPDGDIL